MASKSKEIAVVDTETDIAFRAMNVKEYLAWIGEPVGTPLPEMSIEEAAIWGSELYARRVKVDWKLLDWMSWLLEKHPDTWESIIPLTGIAYGTLRDYMSVAEGTRGIRDPRLSVAYHRVVASHSRLKPEEAMALLDRAYTEKMSIKVFKAMTKAATGKRRQVIKALAQAAEQVIDVQFDEAPPALQFDEPDVTIDVSTITSDDFQDNKPALVKAVTLDGRYPGFEAMFMRGNPYQTIRAMAAYLGEMQDAAGPVDEPAPEEDNPFVPAAGEIWRTKTEPMATWRVLKVEGDLVFARNTATSTRMQYQIEMWFDSFTPMFTG